MAAAWNFLYQGCNKLDLPKYASGSSGGGESSSSGGRTAGKKHGHKQRRGGAAAGSGQGKHPFKDAWAVQPGGAAAFQSVMLSWTRMLVWRMDLCHGELLPSGMSIKPACNQPLTGRQ